MLLTAEGLRWLSGTVRTVYAARSYAELHEALTPRLHARFDSIVSVCESASPDGSQFSLHRLAGRIDVPGDYQLYLWDHPNIIRLLDGSRQPVLHLREEVSRRAYERTDYFNALCRHNALHDQILTVAWQPHRVTSFAINRDRLFTAEEKELLALLQPHLQASLRRVRAHADAETPPFGDPWVSLDADGRGAPVLTPAQQLVLRHYFPDWTAQPGGLPAVVAAWLGDCIDRLRSAQPGRPLCALFVEGRRGRLGLRYFPATPPGLPALRMTESPAGALRFWALAGLTPREREVLGWLAQGKRNGEIATILGIAPATVGKHVEHVLRKLGIRSRAAAGGQLA